MGQQLTEADPQTVNAVLDAATEVHRQLGPGFLESGYEAALCYELNVAGVPFERQVEMPLVYKGVPLGLAFRADLIENGQLLVELKCVPEFERIHLIQVISYLRLLRIRRGYLLNFHRPLMKEGIKRVSI